LRNTASCGSKDLAFGYFHSYELLLVIQWAAKVLRAAAEKCFFENSNISGPTHHIAVLLTVLDSSCSVVLGVKITAYYLKN
jgi:hypothetical protein